MIRILDSVYRWAEVHQGDLGYEAHIVGVRVRFKPTANRMIKLATIAAINRAVGPGTRPREVVQGKVVEWSIGHIRPAGVLLGVA